MKSNYCVFDFCVSKSVSSDALIVEVSVSDITSQEGRNERQHFSRGFEDLRLKYDSREIWNRRVKMINEKKLQIKIFICNFFVIFVG